MGGWPYQHVVPFQENAQAALDALRADVFARGAYHGSEAHPRTIKEALAQPGESGTRSILDIERRLLLRLTVIAPSCSEPVQEIPELIGVVEGGVRCS